MDNIPNNSRFYFDHSIIQKLMKQNLNMVLPITVLILEAYILLIIFWMSASS